MNGDMVTKSFASVQDNGGGRLIKNMRICGSGIYTYASQEVPLLNLGEVPEKHRHLDFINVYRPPEVLKSNKEKFSRVPIITGRHVMVDENTAKDLMVGMVGDTVEWEFDKDDGELYLYTTGTIVAGDGIDAYEKYGQLSVGYDPVMVWEDGEHNGVPYQAVLKGFNFVNHLLICQKARGGPQCMVMDSMDSVSTLLLNINNRRQKMGLFDKILGRKNQTVVNGDAQLVSVLLQSIGAGADAKTQCAKIRQIAGDKDPTFNGFLDELEVGCTPNETKENIQKALDTVDAYYQKVHGDTAVDPEKKEEPAGDTAVEPDKKDEPAGNKGPDKKDEPAGDNCACGAPDCNCDKKGVSGDSMAVLQAMVDAAVAKAMQAQHQKTDDPRDLGSTVTMGDAKDGDTKQDSSFFLKELFGGNK